MGELLQHRGATIDGQKPTLRKVSVAVYVALQRRRRERDGGCWRSIGRGNSHKEGRYYSCGEGRDAEA